MSAHEMIRNQSESVQPFVRCQIIVKWTVDHLLRLCTSRFVKCWWLVFIFSVLSNMYVVSFALALRVNCHL